MRLGKPHGRRFPADCRLLPSVAREARSGARRFVGNREWATDNQHGRVGQVSSRRRDCCHDRRQFGYRHAVTTGGAKPTLVEGIRYVFGSLSFCLCRAIRMSMARVKPRCTRVIRLSLDLMSGGRAKPHGCRRESLQRNRGHQQARQKQAQASEHRAILLSLPLHLKDARKYPRALTPTTVELLALLILVELPVVVSLDLLRVCPGDVGRTAALDRHGAVTSFYAVVVTHLSDSSAVDTFFNSGGRSWFLHGGILRVHGNGG